MTEVNSDTQALLDKRSALQAELSQVTEEIRARGVALPRSKRGRATGGASLSDSLVTLLRDKGPLPAVTIITELTSADGGCKDTSVRTLLSTMHREGKISRDGKRGSFVYAAV